MNSEVGARRWAVWAKLDYSSGLRAATALHAAAILATHFKESLRQLAKRTNASRVHERVENILAMQRGLSHRVNSRLSCIPMLALKLLEPL